MLPWVFVILVLELLICILSDTTMNEAKARKKAKTLLIETLNMSLP